MENDRAVTTIYCTQRDQIVALEESLCRACGGQAGDGKHQEVTPQRLKQMGYVSTPVPETAAQGEESARVPPLALD